MQWLGAHPVTARSLLTLRPDTPRTPWAGRVPTWAMPCWATWWRTRPKPFDTYMRRAILRPLNISRAGYQADERMLELRAAGYRRGKPWSEAPLDNAAAEGLWMSSSEMARFSSMLFAEAATAIPECSRPSPRRRS